MIEIFYISADAPEKRNNGNGERIAYLSQIFDGFPANPLHVNIQCCWVPLWPRHWMQQHVDINMEYNSGRRGYRDVIGCKYRHTFWMHRGTVEKETAHK